MFGTIYIQALDQSPSPPHSLPTCGKLRGGGVVTSDSRRRSISFGRVAVTHVQGSPKGGGALGLLEVTNTRLSPVPSQMMGASMLESQSDNTAVHACNTTFAIALSLQGRSGR